MKKWAVSLIIFMSLVLVSCDLTQLDSIIRISSTIPATVEKLHFAVLNSEEVLEQKVFLKSELNSDGAIEIYVSPGKNRTLVLVTEDVNGFANYYSSKTMDIEAGKEVPVSLSMHLAEWRTSPGLNQNFIDVPGSYVLWDHTNMVKTKYYLVDESNTSFAPYIGYEPQCDIQIINDTSVYSVQLIVEFYPSGLKTDLSDVVNTG